MTFDSFLGVLWAAWWLNYGRHDETPIPDLLLQAIGESGVAEMRRATRLEDAQFTCKFWAALVRREKARRCAA